MEDQIYIPELGRWINKKAYERFYKKADNADNKVRTSEDEVIGTVSEHNESKLIPE